MIIFASVKNKPLNILIISLITLASTMMSCYEDDSCNQNTETGVNLQVINNNNESTLDKDSTFWKFTKMDDTISLVNSNNISYSPGIPLDMNNDSIQIRFQIKNISDSVYMIDTVVFNYIQTDLQALSINCGFAPVFELVGHNHTTNVLDSVARHDSIVNTEITEKNVSFYY